MTETTAAVIEKVRIAQNKYDWISSGFSIALLIVATVSCPSLAASLSPIQPLSTPIENTDQPPSKPHRLAFLTQKTDSAKKSQAKKKKADQNDEADSIEKQTTEGNAKPYSEEAIKHYNHGVELHQAGFLNQAIGEYKAAIDADDRVEEAYSNLGVIYAAQHNYPKAKEAFVQALKLKPNRPTTLNGLGTVLYAQGQITQATEKWKEALAADPKFASAYYNMGNAYEGEKNLTEAKTCYMKSISVMPNMADAYYRLGNILSKEHHYAQAEVLLKKAIELAPDGEFVREARHSLLIIESRFEKANSKNQAQHKNKSNEQKQN